MKISTLFTLVWLGVAMQCFGQEKLWTATDKQATIEQLIRTRDAVVKETENLTPEQWAFRESPDRWSIAEVVEHLALWEIVWFRELSIGTRNKPQPELIKTTRPDSYYQEFIMEPNPHKAAEIAKPTGFIKGKDNLTFFLRGREQSLSFVRTSEADMRAIFELTGTPDPRNMHQVLIYQWGHTDRHLRQILKVKSHPSYPK
nr:DinB family protein [uncultured Dyadobacter sp.]